MHIELRRSGLFDQVFSIPKFDQPARTSVLRALITRKGDSLRQADEARLQPGGTDVEKCVVLDTFNGGGGSIFDYSDSGLGTTDLDLHAIALATDGYGPSDLDVVLSRAYICCANRSMREFEEAAKKMSNELS